MTHVEAVLAYRAERTGKGGEVVSIGRTSDPLVLHALRDKLIEEASREVELWQEVDPALAEMASADADRLGRVLEFLLPFRGEGHGLRLIGEEGEAQDR